MGFIEMLTEKDTLTKNGAVTNSTSHNYNLDLFFLAGACRNESVEQIENLLTKSYVFNRVNTLKIVYWASDIRGGAGERRFFKVALNWLYKNHKEDFYQYLNFDPEFSRWDVLFDFDDDKVISYLCENISNPLLCKWLPRKNYYTDKWKNHKVFYKNGVKSEFTWVKTKKRSLYNGLASKICKKLGWSPKEYRKWVSSHSATVEQQMSANKWSEIDYSKIPSVAFNKYSKAWMRHDSERFQKFIEEVQEGKTKINASAIFPHDIIKNAIQLDYYSVAIQKLTDAQIAQWESLPNWVEPNSFLPVCDTSGSMYGNNGLPGLICLSLGLYLSERNTGVFKDAFMTFSNNPTLQVLKGNINQRLSQLANADWGQNTNLLRVFDIILTRAQEYKLSPDEMPKNLLVISDMEFDSCGLLTNYESIKLRYQSSGYKIPNIVFWNVNGRVGNVPVTVNDQGVALVSGASPQVIRAVLSGDLDPVKCMERTINNPRYDFIQ